MTRLLQLKCFLDTFCGKFKVGRLNIFASGRHTNAVYFGTIQNIMRVQIGLPKIMKKSFNIDQTDLITGFGSSPTTAMKFPPFIHFFKTPLSEALRKWFPPPTVSMIISKGSSLNSRIVHQSSLV